MTETLPYTGEYGLIFNTGFGHEKTGISELLQKNENFVWLTPVQIYKEKNSYGVNIFLLRFPVAAAVFASLASLATGYKEKSFACVRDRKCSL